MGEDIDIAKAPSELRSLAENTAMLGVAVGLAVLAGNAGGAGEFFAGAVVIGTGVLLKAKTDLDTYHRASGPAETNPEYLEKIGKAIKSLQRLPATPRFERIDSRRLEPAAGD